MSKRKVFLPLETLDKCSVCGRTDLKLRWCMSCAEVCGEVFSWPSAQLTCVFVDALLLDPMSDKGLEIAQGQMW